MSWTDLARMGITLRPFDDPPPSGEVPSPFNSTFGDTLAILERELRLLGGSMIVLQVGYRDHDLRVDGLPRANAGLRHDAVALSFTSKWGPLRYETNEFVARYYRTGGDGWQANLRAIALAMEALRKVDRYGVSKRGQQYTGWRALPTSTDPADAVQTREQAEDLLASYGGVTAAIKATHPDVGGDPDEFRRVMRARELVA